MSDCNKRFDATAPGGYVSCDFRLAPNGSTTALRLDGASRWSLSNRSGNRAWDGVTVRLKDAKGAEIYDGPVTDHLPVGNTLIVTSRPGGVYSFQETRASAPGQSLYEPYGDYAKGIIFGLVILWGVSTWVRYEQKESGERDSDQYEYAANALLYYFCIAGLFAGFAWLESCNFLGFADHARNMAAINAGDPFPHPFGSGTSLASGFLETLGWGSLPLLAVLLTHREGTLMAACRVFYFVQFKNPSEEFRRIQRKRRMHQMEVEVTKLGREEENLRRRAEAESAKTDPPTKVDVPELGGELPEEVVGYPGLGRGMLHRFREGELGRNIRATSNRYAATASLFQQAAQVHEEKKRAILAYDDLKTVDTDLEIQRRRKATALEQTRQEEAKLLAAKEAPAALEPPKPKPPPDYAARLRASFGLADDVAEVRRLEAEYLAKYEGMPDVQEVVRQIAEQERLRLMSRRQ